MTSTNSKNGKMKKINLDFLTVEEINYILAVLGKQPFETVYELINKIREQTKLQLEKDKNVKTEKKDATTRTDAEN